MATVVAYFMNLLIRQYYYGMIGLSQMGLLSSMFPYIVLSARGTHLIYLNHNHF